MGVFPMFSHLAHHLAPPPNSILPLHPSSTHPRPVDLDPAPTYPRVELPDLLSIAKHPERIPWKPFKDGVDIHRLYGDGVTGPTAALIRFQPGGKVPLHEHTGYEHIFILSGSQRDNVGSAEAGTLIITPPGTRHSVVSEDGCIVLAIYEKPVKFLQDNARPEETRQTTAGS